MVKSKRLLLVSCFKGEVAHQEVCGLISEAGKMYRVEDKNFLGVKYVSTEVLGRVRTIKDGSRYSVVPEFRATYDIDSQSVEEVVETFKIECRKHLMEVIKELQESYTRI